jgi:hypothetical protein
MFGVKWWGVLVPLLRFVWFMLMTDCILLLQRPNFRFKGRVGCLISPIFVVPIRSLGSWRDLWSQRIFDKRDFDLSKPSNIGVQKLHHCTTVDKKVRMTTYCLLVFKTLEANPDESSLGRSSVTGEEGRPGSVKIGLGLSCRTADSGLEIGDLSS